MNTKPSFTIVAAVFAILSLGYATSASADESWIDRQTFYSIVHSSPAVAASFSGTPATTGQIGRSGAGAHAVDGRAARGSEAWWLHREAVRESSSR
ncbi:hypothetical protein GCM10011322_44620 [Salinarimonas ramus]|uniref:Uncharacterized protein n=1 Tax=Salinarimonas ramus TaxID=690164 RepID=A0A917V9V6_9HYPH|nr:hypothetical protein GCM10011322_44620 [Salinarimonas ramus]